MHPTWAGDLFHPWWDKCSGLVHWEDPEGWDGEGGWRGDWDGEHMYIHGWFMSMYRKNHYNKKKKKDKAKEKMLMKKHKIQTRNNYRNNGYLKMNEIVIKNRKWN